MILEILLLVVNCIYAAESACHAYGGRGYYFHDCAKNFDDAVSYCRSQGMVLTKIRNANHNTWLANKANSINNGKWWVGIRIKGQFRNIDGSTLAYTKWYPGEPNNLYNEYCVHLGHYSNARWNYAKCSNSHRFICESESTKCQGQAKLNTLSDGDKCGYYALRGYLFVNRGMNRANAAKYCEERNMKLANVYDAGHNLWLAYNAKAIRNTRWFIGANDIDKEGTFKNEDGSNPAFVKWYKGQPNNFGNEDCVVLNKYASGYWNDARCGHSNFRFICESSSRTCDQGSSSTTNLANGDKCGYFRQKGYMFVSRAKTRADAAKYCEDRSMKLTSVINREHNNWLFSTSNKISTATWYIGANDIVAEGKWKNADGSTVRYTQWHSGEPNNSGDEDCVHIGFFRNPIGNWNDVACSYKYRFICESETKDCSFYSDKLTTASTGDKCSYYGSRGFLYHNTAKNRAEASTYCGLLGMKLASVLDAHHNQWMTDRAFSIKKDKWYIGVNDIANEGKWKNADGSNLEYTQWHKGEPNNSGNEDCVSLGLFNNADWNDAKCKSSYRSICEANDRSCKIDPPNSHCRARDGRAYFFFDVKLTYGAAKHHCEKVGMRVVTVTDNNLNNWLYETSQFLLKERARIGLSDAQKEGSWVWHSGSSSKYRNWHKGEPNNSGKNEDCVVFRHDKTWNDIPCSRKKKFICESSQTSC